MSDTEEKRHAIGANLPPYVPEEVIEIDTLADRLRATYGHLFTERDALIAAAGRWKANHPKGIADDADQAASTDQLAQMLTAIDAYHGKPTSIHTLAKRPFLEGSRIIDAVLNADLAGKLKDTAAPLQAAMKSYAEARARRLREEAAAEAKRLAQAAAEAAEKARQASMATSTAPTMEDLERQMEAEQEAEEAGVAASHVKASAVSMVRGDYGTSSGLREKWKVRVVNEDLIPRKYMSPNMAMLEAAMEASRVKKGPPSNPPAGVEYYTESSLSVRRS